MKLTLTFWGAPRTKKNSQSIRCNPRTGRRFISPSEAYKAYEADCLSQIPGKARQRIDLPVNVRCVYYMPTRRRVDLTNLLEATDDLLVRAGVLADDNSQIVAAHDGSRVRLDRENPRVEIEIVSMNPMDNDTKLTYETILEVAEMLKKNENAKGHFTLANIYDIFNAFC